MDSVIILACENPRDGYIEHQMDHGKKIYIKTILIENMDYTEAMDTFDYEDLEVDENFVNTIPLSYNKDE
jgi:hypothetical protein